jgi:hypothetical protein
MAANIKVDNTTTRSPSWQAIEKGDRVVVLLAFLLAAMMAIVW